jgi:potassium-dependent mechanosensitive channel
VEALLESTPSTIQLREQENHWRSRQNENRNWRKQLFDWANSAQAALNQIETQEAKWVASLEAHKDEDALGPMLDLLKGNLAARKTLRTQVVNLLQRVVKLQVENDGLEEVASETIHRLAQARLASQSYRLHQDGLPIWKFSQRRVVGESPTLFESPSGRRLVVKTFVRIHQGPIVALSMALLLSLWGARHLFQITRGISPNSEAQAEAFRILRHWFSLGLLPVLLVASFLAPEAPITLLGFAVLLSFIPALNLFTGMFDQPLRALLLCLVAVYTASFVIVWFPLPLTEIREFQFLSVTTVWIAFIWFTRNRGLYQDTKRSSKEWIVFVFALRTAAVVLGAASIANALGYVRLSQFLAVGCVYSAMLAMCIATAVRTFKQLLIAGVYSGYATKLGIIRSHRDAVLRWTPRIVLWAGIIGWLTTTVSLFGLSDEVTSRINQAWNFTLAGETPGFTFGNLAGLLLILGFGYLLASGVRFVLREDVLSRFNLARGLPELIASSVFYVLLLMVFLTGINAGGIQLNKFTVLTGALGVGVGFGLQNIVNNFVSGLILQFERPIRKGDLIEVEGQPGWVTRIGIRSSTIQTFQGAEIIIPNGSLISDKVTNWTLRQPQRRAEISVGVAYGTNPELVLSVLLNAATTHESVLTSPSPAAYFKELGDSSLDFELQFWVRIESNWVRVKSDIIQAIVKSFGKEGIEIPFPQRDLHLRSLEDARRSLVPADTIAAKAKRV